MRYKAKDTSEINFNKSRVGEIIRTGRTNGDRLDIIAGTLNAEGLTTETGRVWNVQTVSAYAINVMGLTPRTHSKTDGRKSPWGAVTVSTTDDTKLDTLISIATSTYSNKTKATLIRSLGVEFTRE